MIAVIDYGVGNLFSLVSALKFLGLEYKVTADADEIRAADKLILPGVGAFGDAMSRLEQTGLDAEIKRAAWENKPLLGICLGMQLLFEKSLEFGEHAGLGLVPGTVAPLKPDIPQELKVPHIGWNKLDFKPDEPLFKYVAPGDCVYFVHSFHAKDCAAYTVATAEYGVDVTAAVRRGNICGMQFHPEKSGTAGLNLIRAWAEIKQEVEAESQKKNREVQ